MVYSCLPQDRELSLRSIEKKLILRCDFCTRYRNGNLRHFITHILILPLKFLFILYFLYVYFAGGQVFDRPAFIHGL